MANPPVVWLEEENARDTGGYRMSSIFRSVWSFNSQRKPPVTGSSLTVPGNGNCWDRPRPMGGLRFEVSPASVKGGETVIRPREIQEME